MSVALDTAVRASELAYDVRGSGPTLILFHGLVHRRHAWDPVVDRLAKHRTVITVDLPGHGESPDVDESGDVLAESLAELEQFVLEMSRPGEKPHLAGNSLGGYAALELAARGYAKSATALSPAGFAVGQWDHRRSVAMFTGLRAAARLLGPDNVAAAVQNPALRALLLGPFYANGWRADVDACAIDVRSLVENRVVNHAANATLTFTSPVDDRCPITVAWGRRDLILPIYQANGVTRVFPHARVIKVAGLGHVPMPDNPELVASLLLAGSA
ncbi:alpha/beta fold hydrolase [Skermania sp. ID1734]|uniref:alpha/beta fold hydrolase n=1 Tax=Skermania sp. ID1734 TaxID=2597516 RepID=UPI002107201B|nr:alpha/beta fold hydrolase [Skermania sp. ID1734]